jgi:hypothetical protein
MDAIIVVTVPGQTFSEYAPAFNGRSVGRVRLRFRARSGEQDEGLIRALLSVGMLKEC